MASRTKRLLTYNRDVQPGYVASGTPTDPYLNLPMNHPDAFADFFATERALRKMATDTDVYTTNDLLFRVKNLVQPSAFRTKGFAYTSDDLIIEDFANQRTLTTPTALGGLYTTSTDAAGSFTPAGDHAEPTANPSHRRYATAAAYATNVAAVAMFKIDRNSANPIVGVVIRSTANTDHYRAEARISAQTLNLVNRATSADTSNASTSIASEAPNSGVYWISVGIRYNATTNRVIAAVNGQVYHDVTASAGAIAQAGNGIGIWQSGASLGSGPVLLHAFAV